MTHLPVSRLGFDRHLVMVCVRGGCADLIGLLKKGSEPPGSREL